MQAVNQNQSQEKRIQELEQELEKNADDLNISISPDKRGGHDNQVEQSLFEKNQELSDMITDMEQQLKALKRENIKQKVDQNDVLADKKKEIEEIQRQLKTQKTQSAQDFEANRDLQSKMKVLEEQLEESLQVN